MFVSCHENCPSQFTFADSARTGADAVALSVRTDFFWSGNNSISFFDVFEGASEFVTLKEFFESGKYLWRDGSSFERISITVTAAAIIFVCIVRAVYREFVRIIRFTHLYLRLLLFRC